MEKLVVDYLRKTGLDIAEKHCEQLIASHPDYPAIISVADTFDELGIAYAVGRKDENGLSEVAFPYLVHFNPSSLKIIESEKDLEDNADHMRNEWSGIIVKVDGNQELKNEASRQAFKKERERKIGAKALMALAAVVMLMPVVGAMTLTTALWFVTALTGLVLGVVLVRKELGLTGAKVEEFCRSGKNTDCGKVLESDAATIWKGIKLTDLVNGYFAGQLLLVLVATQGGMASEFLTGLGAISWLALPMIIYSYYYQGVVTKKWCKLCLLVTAVLIVQGTMSFILQSPFESGFALNVFYLGYAGVVILALIGLAAYLKQHFKKTNELEASNLLSMRIVKSPAVFHTLLSKEPAASPQTFSRHMVLGNADADHTLYLTLNLSCDPCKKTFDKLYHFLNEHGNNLRVNLTLAPNSRELGGFTDNEYFTQYWVDNVAGTANAPAKTLELMKDWYANMESKETFRKLYEIQPNGLTAEGTKVVEEQGTWMLSNGVMRSPTMFFNLRNMPPHYRMEMLAPALPYILAELPVPKQQHQSQH